MSEENREELLNNIYERAYEYEGKYGYCPQAVLAAVQDYFDIIEDEVIQAAHGLAGGGALCGDGTCGGLVGGYMAVSCEFGRKREEFGRRSPDNWTKSARLAKKIRKKFIDEFGSVICRDVQEAIMGRSYDLWDPEDYRKFEAAGAHKNKCTDVTGRVARWTAEILLDEGYNPEDR